MAASTDWLLAHHFVRLVGSSWQQDSWNCGPYHIAGMFQSHRQRIAQFEYRPIGKSSHTGFGDIVESPQAYFWRSRTNGYRQPVMHGGRSFACRATCSHERLSPQRREAVSANSKIRRVASSRNPIVGSAVCRGVHVASRAWSCRDGFQNTVRSKGSPWSWGKVDVGYRPVGRQTPERHAESKLGALRESHLGRERSVESTA